MDDATNAPDRVAADAEENTDADSAEDAGYSQIGFNSEGEDSEEDVVAAREKTGRSREEVETGGLDDHRARAAAEQAAGVQGSAVEAEGSESWVSFGHQRPDERLPDLELRGSMAPRPGARPAEESSGQAGGQVIGQAGGDGWTSGAFDFDDAGWSAAVESLATDGSDASAADASAGQAAAAAAAAAAATTSQGVTKDTPPLGAEEVDLIKRTMAEVQITPPPWVRRMQQLQQVQQMQMQMQQQMQHTAGGPPLEAGAPPPQGGMQGELPPQVQQLASLVPGGQLLPPTANAPSSILGVYVARRVTAKQLAAERRELREQRKRAAAS